MGLQALDLLLTVELGLDGLGALLFRNYLGLVGRIAKLNLHLVHLLHGRLRAHAIGTTVTRKGRVFISVERRFGLYPLRLLLHTSHAQGVLALVLAQIDLDAGLRIQVASGR